MSGHFLWNGVDSRTMGVVVTNFPPVVYPAERAETVAVPGRSGFLTRTEGRHIYDGYIKTIGIGNRRSADHQAIAAWLRGSGELVLSSEPGFVYFARVIKAASLERVMPGVYSGSVGFMVQPLKGRMPPEGDVTWTNGSSAPSLFNPGDVPAKPLVTMSATLSTEEYGPIFILSVGDAPASGSNSVPYIQINLQGRPDLNGCIFDADTRRVTSLDGSEILDSYAVFYRTTNGELFLPEKKTTVVALNVTNASAASMTIRPRWRWI